MSDKTPEMIQKTNLKSSKVTLRMTAEEIKLIRMMAEREGITVSEYFRSVLLTLAEHSIESREFLNSVSEVNKDNVVQVLKSLIIEGKDTTLNSLLKLHENWAERYDRLEKLLGILAYVFLYHMPEVADDKKKEAKE